MHFIGIKSQSQPHVTGNDIPDELWRIIAGYLARTDHMQQYMPVNRSFFNYALEQRYREVRWINLDKLFLSQLRRLQEPLIAQHVRSVYIRAWFIEYLVKRDALVNVPVNKDKTLRKASFISLLSKLPTNSKKLKAVGDALKSKKKMKVLPSQKIINALICAVSGMRNVVQFDFEWRDLPLNKDTCIFLTSTRTAFDKSLRKLVLGAQISKFKELLASANFDNLDELEFHFDYRASDEMKERFSDEATIRDTDSQDLLDTIVPFINRRRACLRSLSISSTSSIDLSEFFCAIPSEHLCSLRRFSIQVSFHWKQLSNPYGILRILTFRAHSLQHVSLTAIWPEQFRIPKARECVYKQKREEWTPINNEILSHSRCLSSLESLVIPFLSLQQTVPLLRRSCDTLTRLCLTDRYLTQPEVGEVLEVFSHRPFELQHLQLEVAMLDLPLLYLLATKLPGLFSLVLVFDESSYFLEPEGGQCNAALLDWRLHDLEVYLQRYQPRCPEVSNMSGVAAITESRVMFRIAAMVPNIRFLKGRPLLLQ